MAGNKLRGAVAERFGNCSEFAAALHWSGRKARSIVNGRQEPKAADIQQMAEALGVMDKPQEFMDIFFGDVDHNAD